MGRENNRKTSDVEPAPRQPTVQTSMCSNWLMHMLTQTHTLRLAWLCARAGEAHI